MPNWTSLFTDNFNRANGSLDVNPWIVIGGGTGTCAIVSNQVRVTTAGVDAADYYIGVTPNADQYASVKVIACAGSDRSVGPILRTANPSTARTYYSAEVHGPLGAGAPILIRYWNAGTPTTLTNSTATVASGDVIGLEAIGTALKMYINGTQVLSTTHGSLTTGFTGIQIYTDSGTAADAIGDDFDTGNASASAAATPPFIPMRQKVTRPRRAQKRRRIS